MYLGLQVNWNQFSKQLSPYQLYKGLHAGKWPDLMTSKPGSESILGYHWTDHTGRPLEPQVHWDATGTILADASTQWCSSGDPVLIYILEHTGRPLEPQVHWGGTGTTLADASTQWCPSGDPVLICIIGTHWNTTGRPLEAHWKHTGYQQLFLQWHSSVHWGLGSKHSGLPLECHWITTGSW